MVSRIFLHYESTKFYVAKYLHSQYIRINKQTQFYKNFVVFKVALSIYFQHPWTALILKGVNVFQRNKAWCGGAIVSKRHIGGFYLQLFNFIFSY